MASSYLLSLAELTGITGISSSSSADSTNELLFSEPGLTNEPLWLPEGHSGALSKGSEASANYFKGFAAIVVLAVLSASAGAPK